MLDGCSGRDLHTLLVFGLAGTVHDTGNLAELTTHFHHHFHGRFTHSRDSQGAKEEGNHGAHEEHSQNVRLVNVNAGDARQTYVGSEEGQCRQCRRGNGKTLTGSRRGVAHRVQVVRALAHLARKTAHFSNTTCVVGDRTKSVDGQLHRRSGHHTGSGNGYTVKTSQQERTVDTASQNQDRENGRFHTYSQTANDVGAVARSRLLNDAIHGAAAHRGVVFGDNAHQGTYHEAQDDGVEDVDALDRQDRTHAVEGERFGQHGFNHKVRSDSRQDHGTPVAEVQGVHHRAVLAFDAHEERTDDREYDAQTGNHHGQQDGRKITVLHDVHFGTQYHRGQHGSYIRTEQVSTHTCNVTYVIAYVVGDGGRVAGIVLRNACFYFTDQIRTYVRRFGVDTATYASKEGDRLSTQGETSEYFQGL